MWFFFLSLCPPSLPFCNNKAGIIISAVQMRNSILWTLLNTITELMKKGIDQSNANKIRVNGKSASSSYLPKVIPCASISSSVIG